MRLTKCMDNDCVASNWSALECSGRRGESIEVGKMMLCF